MERASSVKVRPFHIMIDHTTRPPYHSPTRPLTHSLAPAHPLVHPLIQPKKPKSTAENLWARG